MWNELDIDDYINILEWNKAAKEHNKEINWAGIHAGTLEKIKELSLKEIPKGDSKGEAKRLEELLQ
jgi:hypothetical protein